MAETPLIIYLWFIIKTGLNITDDWEKYVGTKITKVSRVPRMSKCLFLFRLIVILPNKLFSILLILREWNYLFEFSIEVSLFYNKKDLIYEHRKK